MMIDKIVRQVTAYIPNIPRIEDRSLTYGYSNARIRGMKGVLLSEATLSELIKASTVDSMIELLQRSNYKAELNQSIGTGRRGSSLVELAASRNFSTTVKKIMKFSPKGDLPALKALLLRWDLTNLKTIMQARRNNEKYENIKANLFEVGGLGEDDFVRLMKTPDSDLLKEFKKSSLGQLVLSSLAKEVFESAMKSTDSFFKMENEVDTQSYNIVDSELKKVKSKEISQIRQILSLELDAKNILIIERIKKRKKQATKKEVMASLIKGGNLSEGDINKIVDAKDLSSSIKIIKNMMPTLEVSETADLGSLEIAMEKVLARRKVATFSRGVLCIGVILGFLLLKQEEVNNLRKIAKAKEFGMAQEKVREILVVV